MPHYTFDAALTESITALAERIRKEAPEVRRLVVDQPEVIRPLVEFIPQEREYLDPEYVKRVEEGKTKPGAREEWITWATKYLRLLDVVRGLYVPA